MDARVVRTPELESQAIALDLLRQAFLSGPTMGLIDAVASVRPHELDLAPEAVAAAGAKSAPPLPRTRPAARRRPGPWGRGRTALMGAAIVVAGTTAAAATGLLERAGVDMQPVNAIVERVAEAVTGREPAAAVPPERAREFGDPAGHGAVGIGENSAGTQA